MHAALEVLLADGVIDEVTTRLKSGKEADVYIVTHGGQYVAAKIYKERTQRSFKNNSGYKEGRLVRNSRTRRAMEKGSRFGQAAEEEAWKTAEADTLGKLHAAGVRVPAPVMFYEGVLLMELVVDAEGQPAPRLIDALLTPELATEFYRDLRQQAVKILSCDLIHGDLSAYNILLGASGPIIIDFPQTVAAAANSRAEFFFKRDLENLRLFFAGYDPSLMGREGDASEIWRAYVRRELTPDFVPSGRGAPDARGPRRSGGKPHGEGGRSFLPAERPFVPVAEAAAPEVEDEFALLRQGGGERPKVAQLARAGRGGDRSHRGGPGGGPRGGGHSGRTGGGGRRGPPLGGSSPQGAGGQSRPQGERPQGGSRGAGPPNGARAPHGGGGAATAHGTRAPHGGGGAATPHNAQASHSGGGAGQPHGAQAPNGGGARQPHGARAPHGGGSQQPRGARAPHGGGGSEQPHGARASHGGGGSGQPRGARAPPGGGGQGAPHGRRGPHGGGGQGAPRGGHPQHAAGGGPPHAANGGAHPQQHGHQGPRGERPHSPRQPRQGRRGTAPVVSYVSRGAASDPGGSSEES
ncbi:RIO1 family regulatory kinase/ATPase [Hyalangium sp.]|uniref:RIO1 family regulatory kinase/ATPase domain-containing protein n=1 Tax=Hyalangium sp. TaxID=2028555 RepID=UPI002D69F99D|nr:RIO1 family regulatory kinase/ATPase [Hyalangium sp.]HYI02129.1 RIO1 family regulatory kinase/ATPase [Hyalangium sp.]